MALATRQIVFLALVSSSADAFLLQQQPSVRLASPSAAKSWSPCVMLAKPSSRRTQRRAKRQQNLEKAVDSAQPLQADTAAAVPPPLPLPPPPPPPPAAAAAVVPAAVPMPAAVAPPADGMASPPMPEPDEGDPNLATAFVQDMGGVSLPTFDDFRRRDAAEATPSSSRRASRRRAARGGQPPSPPPAKVEPAAPVVQTAQEKLFELLAFDTIDDRVEKSDEAPYDMTARLIGRGVASQGGAYLLPYLQTGHMLLLLVLLLSSTISYPGFPLTEVPDEYRVLIQEGFVINYAINAACAVYSRGVAERKQEPVSFWFVKVLLLGGLALGELTQAVPDPPASKRQR